MDYLTAEQARNIGDGFAFLMECIQREAKSSNLFVEFEEQVYTGAGERVIDIIRKNESILVSLGYKITDTTRHYTYKTGPWYNKKIRNGSTKSLKISWGK